MSPWCMSPMGAPPLLMRLWRIDRKKYIPESWIFTYTGFGARGGRKLIISLLQSWRSVRSTVLQFWSWLSHHPGWVYIQLHRRAWRGVRAKFNYIERVWEPRDRKKCYNPSVTLLLIKMCESHSCNCGQQNMFYPTRVKIHGVCERTCHVKNQQTKLIEDHSRK